MRTPASRPFLLSIGALMVSAACVGAADDSAGELLYRQKCATCHGQSGEGSKRHKQPLLGDRAVPQLAKLIQQTMPEDRPGTLSLEDSTRIAAYVHDAFYSEAARERNQPPRVELARLTVRQYRNAVADVVGSFRAAPKWPEQRGLKAEYFKNRGFRGQDKVLDRIDPEVSFDFGTDTPVPEKTEPHEFSIKWNGSLLAPETGEYEFIIRTEHAARLWLNDNDKPLIDAWVKSGKDTEFRGMIFLIAGRVYPLRLEYSKAKQGVNDADKMKTKPPPVKSSMALLWKAPHRAVDVVPARNLAPVNNPESYIVATPFPPDDRSYGWERGTTVSKEWDQATTEAALVTAGYVAAKVNELAGTKDGAPDRAAKIKDFALRFAERAFRRPLTNEQKEALARHLAAAPDIELGIKRIVLVVLKSPRFLYREAGEGAPDSYDVASRLSFSLWDSIPDADLLKAAAAGQLTGRDQVSVQAQRMLADSRFKAKFGDFLLTWLKLDHVADIAKDPKRFPGFTPEVISDLRTSLELFLEEVVWDAKADFRQLLLADEVYLNGRLAKFYDVDLPADAPFQKVKLNPEQRAGILTHPYLMAAFAYTGETSPIHRGVFLARGILGIGLRPPPEAFTPLPANLHPNLTTRERVVLQTKSNACIACHGVINPLGFPLESFDAVGRFREKDNSKPVDNTGSYQTRTGKVVTFKGPRDLAEFLAGSEEVQEAFAEQLFHHLVQQAVRASGPQALNELRRNFAAGEFNVRKLTVDVLATSALTPRGAHYEPAPMPKEAPAP